jgi:hypothetical protein
MLDQSISGGGLGALYGDRLASRLAGLKQIVEHGSVRYEDAKRKLGGSDEVWERVKSAEIDSILRVIRHYKPESPDKSMFIMGRLQRSVELLDEPGTIVRTFEEARRELAFLRDRHSDVTDLERKAEEMRMAATSSREQELTWLDAMAETGGADLPSGSPGGEHE